MGSTMAEMDLQGLRVLIREDLNVPLNAAGEISEDTRIRRALPTIQQARDAGAAVMLMSHLGRPEEGTWSATDSLAPVAKRLSELLGQEVPLVKDWLAGVDVAPGQIVLCENVRFNVGERANDATLAKKMAALCDVFVMDAFATAHRCEASTEGVVHYAKQSVIGPLLQEELAALARISETPERPLVAIVGGSKVSTKIALLESLLAKVDCLIVGGGIANTLLAAKGYAVGASLYEPDWLDKAKDLFAAADRYDVKLPLPSDVVVAKKLDANACTRVAKVDDVADDEMILDIGPETIREYTQWLQTADSIMWNGPVGVFEYPAFAQGTEALARAIGKSPAFSVAGGGDTLAAIDQFALADRISYISTGGGAFLTLMESGSLPALKVFEQQPA